MYSKDSKNWFDGIETIIREPLRFKAQLDIGENAYKTLKTKNLLSEAWDTVGAATTAATLAKSSTVASAFFTPSGILGAIGIGTAATPVGWIVAAGVVTGGAWFGITRYMKAKTKGHTIVIPNFINTPIDVLAMGLFDLIAPLALKVAMSDRHLATEETDVIQEYFIEKWGYDKAFVEQGLEFIAVRIDEYNIDEVAEKLAEFQVNNPDCNHTSMSLGILEFLTDIMHADGKIDDREERTLLHVQEIFKNSSKTTVRKYLEKKLKPTQ